MKRWQPEQPSLWLCAAKRSRVVLVTEGCGGVMFAPAGGGGGTSHISLSSTKMPRRTGELPSGIALNARKPGWVSSPLRWVPGISLRTKADEGAAGPYIDIASFVYITFEVSIAVSVPSCESTSFTKSSSEVRQAVASAGVNCG